MLRTAQAMGAFGATVEPRRARAAGAWPATARYRRPTSVVDCGNAGTGVRLIMGAAAGFDLVATFTGDPSLRGRPMMRILRPLGEMGATLALPRRRAPAAGAAGRRPVGDHLPACPSPRRR